MEGRPAGAGDEGAAPPTAASDEQLRAALDAMQDHVAIGESVRGEDGTIVDFVLTYMNRASVDGAGRPGRELVGKRVLELYPSWEGHGLLQVFSQVVETGAPYQADQLHYVDRSADGTEIDGYWSLSVVPFGDGYLASSRDVTGQVLAARERAAEQLEAERSRMAVDLLQRAALPDALPQTAGIDLGAAHRPAASEQPVGGDWYDAFELGDGRVGLVIADVAGHGPEAAAYMVQVRNVVRALALEHREPGAVLGSVADVLARLGTQELHATCCYAVADPGDRSVTWARAGHLHPIAIGAPSRVVAAQGGPPLGIGTTATYPQVRLELEAGEGIVLCTDGVVEVRDEEIDDRLALLAQQIDRIEVRTAQELADRLIAAVVDPDDDLAVLCARFADHEA
jgi:hypothetical protein